MNTLKFFLIAFIMQGYKRKVQTTILESHLGTSNESIYNRTLIGEVFINGA